MHKATDNRAVSNTTAPPTETAIQSRCRACFEPIQAGAGTCPHCHSNQHPNRLWQRLGGTLKWIGGIVTTLSLLLAMISLSKVYQGWSEQRQAVTEIADSAQWLLKLGHYDQAWVMYQQAAELNPSASQVRQGQFELAKILVRQFRIEPDQADTVLRQITQLLYRGLPHASPDQVATVLAHIGWAQVLRHSRQLSVMVPVQKLFDEALKADPSNGYANAMYAGWLLQQRPVHLQQIEQANQHWATARNDPQAAEYSLRLQLRSLSEHSFGRDDAIERAALSTLLQLTEQMRQQNQPLPPIRIRQRIIDGYGRMGDAEHVEALLSSVAAKQHLQLYQWLVDGQPNNNRHMQQQSQYIEARLLEQMDQTDTALSRYQRLLQADNIRESLTLLSQTAIERLTGSVPLPTQQRNYRNDPIDADPFNFHLQTLLNYDSRYSPTNLTQALAYFESQAQQPIPSTPQHSKQPLAEQLNPALKRINADLSNAEQRLAAGLLYDGYIDDLRRNNLRLNRIYAHALTHQDRWESAIASLSDSLKRLEPLNMDWDLERAKLELMLAELYSNLPSKRQQPDDTQQALKHLVAAIEHGVVLQTVTDWPHIKSARFQRLHTLPRYQQLIRGR